MRTMVLAALLLSASPLAAQIATPERPVTDPKTLDSPTNPQAREVPLEDIGNSRGIGGVTWSADGQHIFVVTNLTGRYNIWRTMYRDMDEVLKAYLRSLMGTPEDNPEGYDRASPLTYIAQAKAPLLTIQGENDIRVPRGQAQEVEDILKAKGRTVETVFYPLEGHGFRKRENQLDSLKRTVEWFDRYLKPTMAK